MANSMTLLSNLIPKSFWGSRQNKSTDGTIDFDKIEFKTPADINQLVIDDNFFVKADSMSQMSIPTEYSNVLKAHLESIGAVLVEFNTDNPHIFRMWIAPKK